MTEFSPKEVKTVHRELFCQLMWSRSCHRGHANLVVCSVKDTVVLANEDVSKDPEFTRGGGDVDALEAACAIALLVLK